MVIVQQAGEKGPVEAPVARVAVAPGVIKDALGVVAPQVPAQLGAPNVCGRAVQEDLAPIGRGIGAKAPLAQGRLPRKVILWGEFVGKKEKRKDINSVLILWEDLRFP